MSFSVLNLNIWGGRAGKEKVLNFLESHKESTDVVCLQEVASDPYENFDGFMAGGVPIDLKNIMVDAKRDISNIFPDHTAFFCPQFGNNFGLLMLVRRMHTVIDEGERFVHLYKGYMPQDGEDIGKHARVIHYVTLETKQGPRTIMNFHGLWNGKGKGDSDERLKQSENIVMFLSEFDTPIIFCGDFNLLPETESVKKIEQTGVRNLVTEYGVTSTRTSIYTKPDKFADYIFVSKDVSVTDFKVLSDEVSDHAPLFLECE